MSQQLVKLLPTDRVCDALNVMHEKQIRNLPVVDDDGRFVAPFGIRPLMKILLPEAAKIKFGLDDLSFMPDEVEELYKRLDDISRRPVSEFLEKNKKLSFCKPSTSFPELLELPDQSSDSSLPVIVVKGKCRKLMGMVSAWDVLEKIVMNTVVRKADTEADGGQAALCIDYKGVSATNQGRRDQAGGP